MAKGRSIHVVKHGAGWATKREGASRAGSVHSTQAAAITAARATAKREGTNLIIHKKDGLVLDADSYGREAPRRERKF